MSHVKYRKTKPSMPRWWWQDKDGCWFCKNRSGCGSCKAAKKDIKEKSRHDRLHRKDLNFDGDC